MGALQVAAGLARTAACDGTRSASEVCGEYLRTCDVSACAVVFAACRRVGPVRRCRAQGAHRVAGREGRRVGTSLIHDIKATVIVSSQLKVTAYIRSQTPSFRSERERDVSPDPAHPCGGGYVLYVPRDHVAVSALANRNKAPLSGYVPRGRKRRLLRGSGEAEAAAR